MSGRPSYADKMQEFFKLYDRWTPRGPEAIYLGGDWRNDSTQSARQVKMPPAELAVRYARYFWSGGRDGKIVGLPSSGLVNNLSVAYDGSDLADLTKRIQAISDVSMFAHFRQGKWHGFDAFTDTTPPHPGAAAVKQTSHFRCNDPAELGKWLLDCRPMLEAGDVFYYPDVITQAQREYYDDYGPPTMRKKELSIASLADVIIANGKVVVQPTTDAVKVAAKLVYPILQIDLPFIDETSMATFASMAVNNRPALDRARDALRAKMLELDGVANEEKIETAVAKLSLELRDSIREIESEYRSFQRSSAFSVSGASLGTVSATLALSATFADAATLVGAGGGLIALGKAIETHFNNRAKVRERDFFFFWLLQREGRRRGRRP